MPIKAKFDNQGRLVGPRYVGLQRVYDRPPKQKTKSVLQQAVDFGLSASAPFIELEESSPGYYRRVKIPQVLYERTSALAQDLRNE